MKRAFLPILLASALASGCFVDDGPDTVVVSGDSGLLTVTWTVDGTDDPAICGFEGADTIDVFVERSSGGMQASVVDDCEAFVTSVELPRGRYFADALLMDRGGHPITTAVDLGYFEIFGSDELVIDADFPSDAFY